MLRSLKIGMFTMCYKCDRRSGFDKYKNNWFIVVCEESCQCRHLLSKVEDGITPILFSFICILVNCFVQIAS